MKLYDFALAPNPRRVRLFLCEKGIQLETVQVNLADINALVMVDFSGWVDVKPTAAQKHLARWHALVCARPSAKA